MRFSLFFMFLLVRVFTETLAMVHHLPPNGVMAEIANFPAANVNYNTMHGFLVSTDTHFSLRFYG